MSDRSGRKWASYREKMVNCRRSYSTLGWLYGRRGRERARQRIDDTNMVACMDSGIERNEPLSSTEAPNSFAELVEAARRGNEAAARELVTTYQPYIIRTIRRHMAAEIRRKFDSQDFVQAVWASFFRYREGALQANEPKQLARFLAVMARNKLFEELRRRYSSQKYDVARERSWEDVAESECGSRKVGTPSQLLMAHESWQRLLDGLSTRDQAIVELRMAGETQASIAAKLGISARTVSRLLGQLEAKRNETIS